MRQQVPEDTPGGGCVCSPGLRAPDAAVPGPGGQGGDGGAAPGGAAAGAACALPLPCLLLL